MDEHNVDWSKVRRLEIHVGDEKKIVEQDGDSLCLRGLDPDEVNIRLAQYGDSLEMLRICSGDLSGLSFPEGLQVLDLSGMTLATLPESIRKLKKLKKLDLSHTHIGQLPKWLPELGLSFSREWHSSGIILYGAETDGVDMSIFDQPQESILQWFEERERENEMSLNEVKVVFLGDGESGKTHILARLLNDGKQVSDFWGVSSPGIVVKDKTYHLEDRELKIHFWDFGGQEILHSMHRMFLTQRTFYVVVLNVRDGNQDDRARYWLHNLRSFANGAPVLLVLNKMDMNKNARVNENDLRKIYPELTEIVMLSTLKDSDTEFRQKFLDVMLGQIRRMDILSFPFLPAWSRVKERIQNMSESYIHGDTFRRFCDENGVKGTDSVRRDLLRWFSDLGVCVNYTESQNLEDYVILRPDWITNAIYIILYNRTESVRNGMISHETIYRMLSSEDTEKYRRTVANAKYKPYEVDYILKILRKFRLSFLVEDGMEFIPMLCDANAADASWDYENDPDSLEFRIHYEYLPNNVIHRLMVDRHREVDFFNVWLTGVRFVSERMGLSAIVKSEGTLLRIIVRQDKQVKKPQVYLNALRTDLERINQEMGLTISQTQVAYKQGSMVEFFDYDDLLFASECGEEQLNSRTFRRRIPIQDILKQTDHQVVAERKQLLDDIAKACEHIQNNERLRTSSEDERNDAIRNILWSKRYAVAHPSLVEMGHNKNYRGEVDILLMSDDRQPWTVLEALNIKGSGRASHAYWDAHLSKLLSRYNSQGLQMLFLISYFNCRKEEFGKHTLSYSEHMRWYDPAHCKRLPGTYKLTNEVKDLPPFVRVEQCSYDCGGVTTTVYHYMVWVGEDNSPDEPKQQSSQTVLLPEELSIALGEKKPESAVQAEETRMHEQMDSQSQEKTPSTEYRVVILGDSEAGKSLICERMKDPQMDPKAYAGDVTPGINIISKDYTDDDPSVRVNYWDFGGQEILHSMHRMFLAEQTLYVIVLNTRNDNQDSQALFWMRYVQTYAPGAPVLLVLNKIDQNPGAELNLPALKRHFPTLFNILDVLYISAREWSAEKFEKDFIHVLLRYIRQVLDPTCNFKPMESRIRDRLRKERQTNRIIDTDQFRDLCEEMGLDDTKKQDDLMIRFNRAGIVVFFGEKYQMLLDPEWITNAIYKILEKRRMFETNGIIDEQDISKLYRQDPDKVYRSKHTQSVLPVMRAYGLSFQCEKQIPGKAETKDREFIPMLCTKKEPDQVEALLMQDELVEMQMRFEYLPIGVLHQLMVEYQDMLDRKLVWLNGAVFHYKTGVSALVRKDGNVLHLYAWFQSMDISANHLQQLAERVKKIANELQHRAKLEEVLIGFNVAGITEFFDYERLLNAKTCSIQYTTSKIRPDPISVQDILDQTDRSEGRDVRELLRLVAAGCRELQMNQTYWFWESNVKKNGHIAPKMDENARNRLIRFKLEQSFAVKDQPQGGESSTGVSPGELDLWIGTDMDSPLAILEALNITGDDADSRKRWKEHLHRLVVNYNKPGYRCLVLVSYLNCPEEQMSGVQKVYSGLLKESTFEIYGGTQPFLDTEFLPNCPNLIHITRADYSGGAGNISVYHFLVHIPRYLGDQ